MTDKKDGNFPLSVTFLFNRISKGSYSAECCTECFVSVYYNNFRGNDNEKRYIFNTKQVFIIIVKIFVSGTDLSMMYQKNGWSYDS